MIFHLLFIFIILLNIIFYILCIKQEIICRNREFSYIIISYIILFFERVDGPVAVGIYSLDRVFLSEAARAFVLACDS